MGKDKNYGDLDSRNMVRIFYEFYENFHREVWQNSWAMGSKQSRPKQSEQISSNQTANCRPQILFRGKKILKFSLVPRAR